MEALIRILESLPNDAEVQLITSRREILGKDFVIVRSRHYHFKAVDLKKLAAKAKDAEPTLWERIKKWFGNI